MEVKRGCESCERALLPGEYVEWTGEPEPVKLLTDENRSSVILQWAICGAVCVVLSALYAVAVARAGVPFSPLFEAAIIAVCGFVALTPVRDRIEVQKRARYYLTNKRAILMVGTNLYALNRTGIRVERRDVEDGNLSVLFGSCVGIPSRKCRRAAILPEIDEDNLEKNGFVFYNVREDGARLENLLFH